MNWNEIREMAAAYLSEFIQINTSKENELEAVKWLAMKAQEHGLHYTIQETAPNRGNIIVSLAKSLSSLSEPIILLSHVDVVPAEEADWKVPPFSGEIINGELWGRGTIDTKQLTITHLMVLILLNKNQIHLEKDVLMVATADEESGSKFGLLALLKEQKNLFYKSLVFNEGGGFPIHINGKDYYLCEMGQKGIARIKISTLPLKGSNPYLPNNTSHSVIIEVINRLRNLRLNESIPAATLTLMQQISTDLHADLQLNEIDQFITQHIPGHLHSFIRATCQTTFSITKWKGGRKNPDLKGTSDIYIDCRPLPYMKKEDLQSLLEDLLKDLPVTYRIFEFSRGFETMLNQEDLTLFEQEIRKKVPSARVVPFLSIGASDSRHLIDSGSQVYGYCPMLPDMSFDKVIKLVHGKNERIPLASLLFGIQNMYEIVQKKGAGTVATAERNHSNE